MISEIVHIGKEAVSTEENILILFGEDASPAIKNVSVLQSFKKKDADFELKLNHTITIGDQVYTITFVGENVSANLRALGHVTLVFKEFDEDNFIETSVYLTPHQLPHIETGMTITYQ